MYLYSILGHPFDRRKPAEEVDTDSDEDGHKDGEPGTSNPKMRMENPFAMKKSKS